MFEVLNWSLRLIFTMFFTINTRHKNEQMRSIFKKKKKNVFNFFVVLRNVN